MATGTIGTDRRSRTKLVALVVVLAIATTLFAMQATSLLSTTTATALRPPPVIVLNELPTGPQHGQGPHPHKITLEDRSLDARSRVALAGAKRPEDYTYEPVLRKVLLATRLRFDPADGLQQWERALLAMDPNGATAPGR
jgi:hypothetical protein